MKAEHITLLHCCDARSTPYAKVRHRLFELKEGIWVSLSPSSKVDDANLCYNGDFIQKFGYWLVFF
jgi:hypothetical protein